MTLADYFSLGILAIVMGAQIFLRPLALRIARIALWLAVFLIVIILVYWSLAQYRLWHESGEVARYLLPPYQTIGYFLSYVFFRFWLQYLISFVLGLLIGWGAYYANKKFQDKFFYLEEIYILIVTIFLVGHPLWLLYLVVVLTLWCLISLVSGGRVSFYYFWIPVAASVILLKGIILDWKISRLLQI